MGNNENELFKAIVTHPRTLQRPARYDGDEQPGPLIGDLAWNLISRSVRDCSGSVCS